VKRLLILSSGADIAGCGNAMKRAFDTQAPNWRVRQVCRRPSPYGYPADLLWYKYAPHYGRIGREVNALFGASKVIHVMEEPEYVTNFPGWQRKTIIVHHLGTYFRKDPEGVSAKAQAIGATEVVDMHELMYLPHLQWLPTPLDLDRLGALRAAVYRPGSTVRIVHAPTKRAVKGTDHILSAIDHLAKRYPIEFDLIEGRPNEECLLRKAQADILVDALSLGPTVNAVESFAMGVPVVCGIKYWTLREPPAELRQRMLADWGTLPFVEATIEDLEDVLERLIRSPELRREWGERGREHAYRFHSQRAVVLRALGIYAKAMERKAAAA
jgi:hypothetical protein